jgi:hypothetical protein
MELNSHANGTANLRKGQTSVRQGPQRNFDLPSPFVLIRDMWEGILSVRINHHCQE